jgi:hypothetical protein
LKTFPEKLRLFLINEGFSKISRLFKYIFSGIEAYLKQGSAGKEEKNLHNIIKSQISWII